MSRVVYLAAGNEVIMYLDGSIKKVEDLVEGDELLGEDGNPRVVVDIFDGSTTEYGDLDSCYEIECNDDSYFTIGAQHSLTLWDAEEDTMVDMTLDIIADLKSHTKHLYIPVADPNDPTDPKVMKFQIVECDDSFPVVGFITDGPFVLSNFVVC